MLFGVFSFKLISLRENEENDKHMIDLLQKFDLMRKNTSKSVLPHYEHNRQIYKEF